MSKALGEKSPFSGAEGSWEVWGGMEDLGALIEGKTEVGLESLRRNR